MIADDTGAVFNALNLSLNQNAAIPVQGRLDGWSQIFKARDPAEADGGTEPGGFDKERQSQRAAAFQASGRIFAPGGAVDGGPRRYSQPYGFTTLLGQDFVDPQYRAFQITASIR